MKHQNQYSIPVGTILSEIFNNGNLSQSLVAKTPKTNLYSTADRYFLEVAAPGLQKSDFTISLEENQLHISAKQENPSPDSSLRNQEFDYSTFSTKVNLPKDIDRDSISAEYKLGILTIALTKDTSSPAHRTIAVA
jgi:HSP20 family protein